MGDILSVMLSGMQRLTVLHLVIPVLTAFPYALDITLIHFHDIEVRFLKEKLEKKPELMSQGRENILPPYHSVSGTVSNLVYLLAYVNNLNASSFEMWWQYIHRLFAEWM